MRLKSFNWLRQTPVARKEVIENNGTAQMFCSVIDLNQLTNPITGHGVRVCVRYNEVPYEKYLYSLLPY
jgi:hypothetical protein